MISRLTIVLLRNMSKFDSYLADMDSVLFPIESVEDVQEVMKEMSSSEVKLTHTEALPPALARQIVGEGYRPNCTYQLIMSTEGVFVQQCNPDGDKSIKDNPEGYLYTFKLAEGEDCETFTEMQRQVMSDETMWTPDTPARVFEEPYHYERANNYSWILVPSAFILVALVIGIILFIFLFRGGGYGF